MSTRQTTEQRRARRAMEYINQVKESKDDSTKNEYSSLARSAPAYIQSSGLGQTLAFYRSKGWEKGKPKEKSAHALLYDHISQWVCAQMGWNHGAKSGDLLGWLVEKNTDEYRRATAEAQAFLVWLKRFAEAELGQEERHET